MKHPYESLPSKSYWRTGVAEKTPFDLEGFYTKRFEISKTDKIATAGSCFAQHVARHMKARGFPIVDVEPPLPRMSTKLAQKYGFATYSARYGNIYTTRQLRQLVDDCRAPKNATSGKPSRRRGAAREEDIFEKDGRFYDGLRPNIEPNGLASVEDVREMRLAHLRQVRRMLRTMDVFVFTLGLTETWENIETGTVYPVCPGVIAGEFSDKKYRFRNLSYQETIDDFKAVYRTLMKINPKLKILVTVSPVPLTATASNEHILSATTYSKSVLRAVCGELVATYENIDYFPSYELITAPMSGGQFFADNLRSVLDEGVQNVMSYFFAQHDPDGSSEPAPQKPQAKAKKRKAASDDLVCEEILLDAFNKK